MPDVLEVKSPYPGLRSFEPHEAEIFFGREAHTDRLLEILQRERFLAVLGPSGAGKSSLVRAGLLPGLAAGWLGGASDWRIAILRPGERPFRRLAEELVQSDALGPDESSLASLPAIEAEPRRGPLGLADLLTDVRRGTIEAPFKLLVLVDQFEEIFRYAQAGGIEADESEAFVNLLLASRAVPEAEIYVALTMRTDFLGHCVRFLELPEALNRAQYLIPRLTHAELERTITGPALVFGGDVAPELVTTLINSLDQDFDQLPLLQHAMARMWNTDSDKSDAPLLTVASLEALGGLHGALSAHAKEIYERLSEREQALAETLFRCVTLREGTGQIARSTRRPQRLQQIAAVAECDWRELETVVRSFAAEGVNFLHYGEPLGSESVIDISHEALIRQWERLRAWAEDEAKQAAEAMRWLDRAVMWKQEKGELLTGADLARAVDWLDKVAGRFPKSLWPVRYLDPEAEIGFGETLAFIAESEASDDERRKQETLKAKAQEQLKLKAFYARAEANRARAEAREWAQAGALVRWSRWLSLAVLTASALLLVPVALSLARSMSHSTKAREEKESLARQLALEASFLAEREPERAQLLAVEALETLDLPVSNFAVRQAYGQSENLLPTLRGHKGAIRSAVFNLDGRTVLTASEDNTARLWDAATGQTLHTFRGHEDSVVSAVFSGRIILTASDDNTARLWDAATGQTLQVLRGHLASVVSAIFSPDGRTVLTASEDNTARLWDAATGRILQTLRGHKAAVSSAVFSPEGRTVLTASEDNTARLWDAATGDNFQTLRGHEAAVDSAVFSPDGRTILTASEDNTARMWDAATGDNLQTLRGHEAAVFSAVFSPNGQIVLTAGKDNTARLWDAATGDNLQTLRGHEGTVSSAVFSPDGRTILTASNDKTARLWDTATGRALQTLRGHEASVDSAVFSPDGRTMLTASEDTTAQLWPCNVCRPTKELANEILHRVGRTLTAEERAQSGLPPLPEDPSVADKENP